MHTRRIGPFEVSAIGLGCMNLSHAYGAPPSPEEGERVLLAALDAGETLFDTAALYGFGANEELVGRVLKPHRDRITLCSKGGMAGVKGEDGVVRRVIDGRPETLRRNCEDSLRRLGTDVIDLYYLHRWDKKVPIEDSVGALSRLVEEGKVRALGLSEVSAATVRRAHAVHPVAAVQTEYSLWTRNAEIAVLAACREIGAAFVAFSPLARAFLTGTLTEVGSLDAKDIRRPMPRFSPENYARNLQLLPAFEALAREAGCTPGQLALAWLLHQGSDIVPIPGTTSVAHLLENLAAADLALEASVLARAGALINQETVTGERYAAQSSQEVDTEVF
ncbi:Predicted oxidoreductase [Variovorax sp. HW608]|uniref:aldo/keto reductase n=1 Tax=Variovorax sp. HW608 TaxID=1034889 RepID=UPI00081FAA78|nr:aldo/keto reductase [Variovorax sp. HW608]SCK15703.1 Predicted oxidoreductase [Variovorax sp. HW608]